MTQQDLMAGLSILLAAGVLLFILFSILKKRLPASAWQFFSSRAELLSYYDFARRALFQRPWLLILPLALVAAARIIQIVFFLSAQSPPPPEPGTWDLWKQLFSLRFFSREVLTTLLHAARLLRYGFDTAISGNLVFQVFFLICALTYRAESRRLQALATAENQPQLVFYKKILRAALVVFILLAILFGWLAWTDRGGPAGMESMIWPLLVPAFLILQFFSLSLFSLVEGFLLFSVLGIIRDEPFGFEPIVNQSLAVFKPLFFWNIILFGLAHVSSLLLLPHTLGMFFSLPQNLSWAMRLAHYYGYVYSLVMIFAAFVPFVIVICRTGTRQALGLHLAFVRHYLVKYLVFAGTGLVLLSLPALLNRAVTVLLQQTAFAPAPYGLTISLSNLLFDLVTLTLAVVFYMAIFRFMFDKLTAMGKNGAEVPGLAGGRHRYEPEKIHTGE